MLSPFMGPKDNPDALFAIGTTKSCEAIGFLFLLGFQCLLLYTVFLTYYFMRRIKYKVTAQNFAKKEEKYLHGVSILITFSMALTALVAGSINRIPMLGGKYTFHFLEIDHNIRGRQLYHRRRFGNTTDYPEWLFWLNSLFTPLGGVFNILIYTRPKVLRLKEDYPHVQTWRLLIVIVLTGGEVPSLADLRQERSPTEPRNNTNDEEPFNDNGQVSESQGEQDDDLFSYEMDVSDALDYLSYSSGSGWLSSFWGSGN
ncbi:predicted protein [Chaetoceros tenuissimus]|uniref:Uncharacterized protein n=1 Tax=Chaetoceros tenuissimus TaxID=426638 RepID=A0AAD3H457_9STRA|nr:predicted protein [Chaetoceros tenuissimus]